MDKIIEMIFTSGPAVLFILAGLVWGKNLIEYFFSESIEIKKEELKQENKNFQHQLDTKLQEFNIQFSLLHQERGEVIKNLYTKIIELQSAMFDFTRTLQIIIEDAEIEERQRVERVNKALKDFANYYMPNKIFFTQSLANKIDKLLEEYWDKGWDYARMNKEFKKDDLPSELFSEYLDKTREISEKVDREFPPLIQELEVEFRKILGVE